MKRLIIILLLALALPGWAADLKIQGWSYPNVFEPSDTTELIFYGPNGTYNMPWSVLRDRIDRKMDATAAMLSAVTAEAAGANCTNGGQRLDIGLDDDADGILDAEEIDATRYVCNGAPGSDGQDGTSGTDGLATLATVTAEAAGANCANGGQRLDIGIDDDSDTVLDAGEIDYTSYVCNGADGASDWSQLSNVPDFKSAAFADVGNTAGDIPVFVACGTCSDNQYATESACTGGGGTWTLSGDICLNVELDINDLADANNLIAQTLSQLSCSTSGQIPKWNGSTFVCGTDDQGSGSLTITETTTTPAPATLTNGDVVVATSDQTVSFKTASGVLVTTGTYTADPVTYTLTVDIVDGNGTDKITYLGTDYTTDQTFSGLTADATFTVTADVDRAGTCTGAGLIDAGGGTYTANTASEDVTAVCTFSASGGTTFTDAFDYSDGVLATVSSGAWSTPTGSSGSVSVVSNKISRTTYGVNGQSLYTGTQFNDNQYSQITLGSEAAANDGIFCRADDSLNGYAAILSSSTRIRIQKFVAGSGSDIDVQPADKSLSNATVKLECNGTSLSLYVNDTLYSTATDATYTSGYVGVQARNDGTKAMDDFVAGDL